MILVSHRGNISGFNDNENNPILLNSVVDLGFQVEIDVWYLKNKLFLGHDSPKYEVDLKYIQNSNFWCHAKSLDSLEFMLENNVHCFWHQNDDYTLTSRGFIWTFPNKPVCKKSVIVCHSLEETKKYSKMNIAGVCSDFVEFVR